jgi:alkylation response protein AidB-like acyl-CoA dehydrogenase
MLREMLNAFAEREMPHALARGWDSGEVELDRSFVKSLAALDLTGVTVDEEYGGSGVDIRACLTTLEVLASRSTGAATLYQMVAIFGGMNIGHLGTDEQKRELLPRVVSGDLVVATGLSEPDIGADLASVSTRVERDGDMLVVNGAKRWCTGAAKADLIWTLCRSDPNGERYRNLSLLLIPVDADGVLLEEQQTMGNHGPGTYDVTFRDVHVPLTALLGGEAAWNHGWSQLLGTGLDLERMVSAVQALGNASAAVDAAWQYSQERVQFGRPICALQSIRHMLADVQTKLAVCRVYVDRVVDMLEKGRPAAVETSMAKLFVCDTARDIVLTCQTVMGAYGYSVEYNVERYVRDGLLMPIAGGSSAIMRNNITNWMGLPR